MAFTFALSSFAQSHSDRISFGVGALYERGFDATLSWEHETKYHNAWEYFVNGYIKWDDCESCRHVCPESFWKNYRTWGAGIAYPVSIVGAITTAISVSEPVPEAIPTSSLAASISATSTIMFSMRDGYFTGRLNVISCCPTEKTSSVRVSY